MTANVTQAPGGTLTWSHDWSDFLAAGETIASRVWTIDPDESPTLLADTTAAAVTVAGLAAGTVYRLTETVTTSAGVIAPRAIVIRADPL